MSVKFFNHKLLKNKGLHTRALTNFKIFLRTGTLCMIMGTISFAYAGKLVYTPNNPSFGGNPSNGVIFLNEANAQNSYKDPSTGNSVGTQSFDQRLKSRLDDAVINRISSSLSRSCSSNDTACNNLANADYDEPISIGSGIIVVRKPPSLAGSSYDNYLITYPNGTSIETSF